MNTTNETWKDIPGYEGLYQVSNEGRVKVLGRYRTYEAKAPSFYKEKILKPRLTNIGRWEVILTKNKNAKHHQIHRLVLTAFIGECPDNMEGCHNDGNQNNNHLSNLRWDTHKNNIADKAKHGTSPKGSNNPNSKLQDIDVLLIRTLAEILPTSCLASIWDISKDNISLIANRKTWAHI